MHVLNRMIRMACMCCGMWRYPTPRGVRTLLASHKMSNTTSGQMCKYPMLDLAWPKAGPRLTGDPQHGGGKSNWCGEPACGWRWHGRRKRGAGTRRAASELRTCSWIAGGLDHGPAWTMWRGVGCRHASAQCATAQRATGRCCCRSSAVQFARRISASSLRSCCGTRSRSGSTRLDHVASGSGSCCCERSRTSCKQQ